MAIYFLMAVLSRCENAIDAFSQHPEADAAIASMVRRVAGATEKDPDVLHLLAVLLAHTETQNVVLVGDNSQRILRAIGELLVSTPGLAVACSRLLQAIIITTDPGVLFSVPNEVPGLVKALSGDETGKSILCSMIPSLQWWPQFVLAIPLACKVEWVSEQIRRSGTPGQEDDKVQLVVHRAHLLEGLCDQLGHASEKMRRGVDVQFRGDDESGLGDGHRREFFCLTAAELMNADAGLFKSNDGGRSYHLNGVAADAQPDHLAQFELCGKLIGLHRKEKPDNQTQDGRNTSSSPFSRYRE